MESTQVKTIPSFDQYTMRSLISQVKFADSGCWEWHGTRTRAGYGIAKISRVPYLAHRIFYSHMVEELDPELVIDHLCRNHSCVNPAHLDQVTVRENTERGESPIIRLATVTHCPAGHPYDDENTYVAATGGRHCKECSRQRTREWRGRRKQSHCAKGHPFTPENTVICNGGTGRRCRICTDAAESSRPKVSHVTGVPRGRPFLLSDDQIRDMRTMKADGVTQVAIAKHFHVSTATVSIAITAKHGYANKG